MKKDYFLPLSLACFMISSGATAEINFSGFTSIKMGMTTEEDETIVGYTDDVSFKAESLAALQASANLGEGLSATAQILARGRENYDPVFEWAYLKYEINDKNSITAGRIRIPFYKYSEYLDVGFAYHWVRPPDGVYSIPFNSWDGVSWLNNHHIGDWDGQLQLQVGVVDDDNFVIRGANSASPLEFRGLSGEYTISNGPWSGRVGYLYSPDLNIEIAALTQAVAGVEAQTGSAIGDPNFSFPHQLEANIIFEKEEGHFSSVSVFYDPGNWFAGFELTSLYYETMNFLPNQESAYVTGGVRLDDWTIHLTHGIDKNDKKTYAELTRDIDEVDAATDSAMRALYGVLTASGAAAGEDSHSTSLGVNYNFHPKATLKLDYTQYRDDINAPGGRTDADLFSISIDTIF